MRLFKFLLSVTVVTSIALTYVHQQVELVRLSYALDDKERKLERLLDRKDGLLYNIKGLENPSRLEKVLLSRNIDIVFPKRGQIVSAAGAVSSVKTEERLRAGAAIERKAGIFRIFEFLSLRAEAQAGER